MKKYLINHDVLEATLQVFGKCNAGPTITNEVIFNLMTRLQNLEEVPEEKKEDKDPKASKK